MPMRYSFCFCFCFCFCFFFFFFYRTVISRYLHQVHLFFLTTNEWKCMYLIGISVLYMVMTYLNWQANCDGNFIKTKFLLWLKQIFPVGMMVHILYLLFTFYLNSVTTVLCHSTCINSISGSERFYLKNKGIQVIIF